MQVKSWLVECRIKAIYPLVGSGPAGGVLSVGVFLRDHSLYLYKFRRKPCKTPKGKVDKHDQGLNLAPTIYQFESRTTLPLVRHISSGTYLVHKHLCFDNQSLLWLILENLCQIIIFEWLKEESLSKWSWHKDLCLLQVMQR